MIDGWISKIRDDHVSGAAALTREAARALSELSDSPAEVRELCRVLPSAQPAMASLVRLSRAALAAGSDSAAIREACRRFVASMEASESRIASTVAGRMPRDAVVLTHSSSSAVRAALLAAHSAGKLRQVICTESQPMREGAELARALCEAGLNATVLPDAAMASVMDRIHWALAGADAVGPYDFTNKVGTLTLAWLCRLFAKPLYILCGEEKFLPPDYDAPAPGGDFEAIPRVLAAGFITGAGLQLQS